MPIIVTLDEVLVLRGMTLTQLSEAIDVTLANLSILKTGKGKSDSLLDPRCDLHGPGMSAGSDTGFRPGVICGCGNASMNERHPVTIDSDTVSTSDRQLRYARVAGVALLVICLSGVLSNNLVVPGDAEATARNILGHERWFRVGLAGELLMVNADVVVAVALYALLEPVSAPLAMLGMLWRLANVLVQAVGIVVSLVALDCLGDTHYRMAFTPSQLQGMARQLLDIHGTAMGIGLVFFGLGAAIHAYLLWLSLYVPRILSGAYVVVTLLVLLSCSAVVIFPSVEAIIDPWLIAPDFFVEFAVAVWLTTKGAKIAVPPHAFGI